MPCANRRHSARADHLAICNSTSIYSHNEGQRCMKKKINSDLFIGWFSRLKDSMETLAMRSIHWSMRVDASMCGFYKCKIDWKILACGDCECDVIRQKSYMSVCCECHLNAAKKKKVVKQRWKPDKTQIVERSFVRMEKHIRKKHRVRHMCHYHVNGSPFAPFAQCVLSLRWSKNKTAVSFCAITHNRQHWQKFAIMVRTVRGECASRWKMDF